jgi:hypothetical protein
LLGKAPTYELITNGEGKSTTFNVYTAMTNNINYNFLDNYLDWDNFFGFVSLVHYCGHTDLGFDHNWELGK